MDEHIKQVTDGHQIGDFERVAMIDEQLAEHLEGRAFPLQYARHCDERLDEGWREGINLPEHRVVAVAREECLLDGRANSRRLLKRSIDLCPGRFALGLEEPAFGDHGEVAVLQRDHVEAILIPPHELRESNLLVARHLAHEFLQVSLPRDEAHDRHGAVGVLGLDQLGELGGLVLQKRVVGGMGSQPQHELVQKQHEPVVAEALCMPREH